jgi:hypothetical protein
MLSRVIKRNSLIFAAMVLLPGGTGQSVMVAQPLIPGGEPSAEVSRDGNISAGSAGVFLGISISPQLLSPAPVPPQTASGAQDPSGSWLVGESFSPPSRGSPGTAVVGRSRCDLGVPPGIEGLAPLIPADAMPFTVSEYPRFFWYVPPATSLDESYSEKPYYNELEFALIDVDSDSPVLYAKKLSVPSPGIVSHQLSPGGEVALEENKQYYWVVKIVCDSEDASGDQFVDGWVERIAVSDELQAELDNATENDRPYIYAREGIWYEALTTLARLREKNPEDETILSRWSEFLQSVNLGQLTEEPLIQPEAIAEP